MELSIQAKARSAFGRQNKKLRESGSLPAVLYGRGKETEALEVRYKDFEKVYRQAGENTLVDLVIDDNTSKKVLIHDVARHFMKNEYIHVDFYEVDLTRKIHAKIPLHFVGTAPAIKELGGILVKNLNEIEVEALPANLPSFIEVDISSLKTFQDSLRISDLKLSADVKILGHAEEVMVSAKAPRTEEELAELEKPTADAEKAAIESMAAEDAKAKEAAAAKEGETTEEKKPAETKAEKK